MMEIVFIIRGPSLIVRLKSNYLKFIGQDGGVPQVFVNMNG